MSKVYEGSEPYVFVSYSHKDREKVESVIELLQRSACNIWYDIGISAGSSWSDNIAEHLKNATAVLLFVTKNSITSDYVKGEINYAIAKQIHVQPCYLEEVELSPGLELLLGAIESVQCHSDNPADIYNIVKGALPQEVFHKSGAPFYSGRKNFFYIKDTSAEFPAHAYFAGEKDCSFEISYTSENGPETVLWTHHAPPMCEICGLSVSGVYRFEDPYFDKTETDVVIFNLLLHLLARYPTPFPDVDVVLTIGIVDVDSDAPKLVGINCKAFDLQLNTRDQRDIDYSEGVAKSLLDEINHPKK